jgi:hypothetical protein
MKKAPVVGDTVQMVSKATMKKREKDAGIFGLNGPMLRNAGHFGVVDTTGDMYARAYSVYDDTVPVQFPNEQCKWMIPIVFLREKVDK